MAVSITHAYPLTVGEAATSGTPGGAVGPNEWNANHAVSGLAPSATIDTTNASNITSGTLPAAQMPGSINTQIASYALALSDNGGIVEMNVSTANNLTVPPNSSVAFPINTQIEVVQIGTGRTTFVAGAGVTIDSARGAVNLATQFSGATLYKRGTNEWVLIGSIA